MTSLNPYLHFEGTARAAIERYQAVFGGEAGVMTYGDMGMTGEHADKVMHAALTHPDLGVLVMASDYLPGMGADSLPANGMIALSGDDAGLLRGWFDALADGGQVHEPLSVKEWGDEFGQVQDAFGVVWVVNIATAQE